MGKINVTAYVDTEVEVDIDIDDIVAQADPRDLQKLLSHFPAAGVAHSDGSSRSADDWAEAAYLAAKAMPSCPQAIRDLLWRVHGRAI